jgi:hypothetical protein
VRQRGQHAVRPGSPKGAAHAFRRRGPPPGTVGGINWNGGSP